MASQEAENESLVSYGKMEKPKGKAMENFTGYDPIQFCHKMMNNFMTFQLIDY